MAVVVLFLPSESLFPLTTSVLFKTGLFYILPSPLSSSGSARLSAFVFDLGATGSCKCMCSLGCRYGLAAHCCSIVFCCTLIPMIFPVVSFFINLFIISCLSDDLYILNPRLIPNDP